MKENSILHDHPIRSNDRIDAHTPPRSVMQATALRARLREHIMYGTVHTWPLRLYCNTRTYVQSSYGLWLM